MTKLLLHHAMGHDLEMDELIANFAMKSQQPIEVLIFDFDAPFISAAACGARLSNSF